MIKNCYKVKPSQMTCNYFDYLHYILMLHARSTLLLSYNDTAFVKEYCPNKIILRTQISCLLKDFNGL